MGAISGVADMSRTFHHSSLDSPRLAKLLAFLRERGASGATTLELCQACCSTRASSDVSEARACGVRFVEKYEGKNSNGRRITRYFLAEFLPTELALA
jgi:hypothetical protein